MSRYPAVLLAACLSACGMKGSLELPPGPPQEPLLGGPANPLHKKKKPTVPAARPTAPDVSTDEKPASE